MRNPFTLLKKQIDSLAVRTKSVPAVDLSKPTVNKPVESIIEEKRNPAYIPNNPKGRSKPPKFTSRMEYLRRKKRNIRNRIQKISRINNR